jgi:hypothetical protein
MQSWQARAVLYGGRRHRAAAPLIVRKTSLADAETFQIRATTLDDRLPFDLSNWICWLSLMLMVKSGIVSGAAQRGGTGADARGIWRAGETATAARALISAT